MVDKKHDKQKAPIPFDEEQWSDPLLTTKTIEEALSSELSRRSLLRGATIGALSSLFFGVEAWAKRPELPHQRLSHLQNIGDVGQMIRGQGFSRTGYVVQVHHPSVYPNTVYPVNSTAVNQMMSVMMMKLTGKTNPKDAWGAFVGPGDRVGILVDAEGTIFSRNRIPVIAAVVAGLRSAGVRLNDITIWTNWSRYLPMLGFKLNWSRRGLRVVGADQIGYDKRYGYRLATGLFGSYTYLSKIVSSYATHIINIATLEDHPIIGCRLSLAQQVLGSYSGSRALERQWGGNKIGLIATQSILRQRFKLHIIDGLAGAYNGNAGAWNPQILLASTDPVALDRIGFSLIERKRLNTGLSQIATTRRSPIYLNTAAMNGLGIANLLKINYQQIHLR